MLHVFLLEGSTACRLRSTTFGIQCDIIVGITAVNCITQTSNVSSFKNGIKFL